MAFQKKKVTVSWVFAAKVYTWYAVFLYVVCCELLREVVYVGERESVDKNSKVDW